MKSIKDKNEYLPIWKALKTTMNIWKALQTMIDIRGKHLRQHSIFKNTNKIQVPRCARAKLALKNGPDMRFFLNSGHWYGQTYVWR